MNSIPKIIYKQQHVGSNGRKFSPSRNAHYVQYIGYSGEDLNDMVSFGDVSLQRIKKIELSGGKGTVKTLLGVYSDAF